MRTRGTAAIVVGLFAASLLAAALHDALAVHAICAEHGEVVHVDGRVVSPTGASARKTSLPTATGSRVGKAPTGQRRVTHEHAACALFPSERRPQLTVDATAATRGVELSLAAGDAPSCLQPHARSALGSAPKTSPPLA